MQLRIITIISIAWDVGNLTQTLGMSVPGRGENTSSKHDTMTPSQAATTYHPQWTTPPTLSNGDAYKKTCVGSS